MSIDSDRPATKRDLDQAITELKQYILDREIGLMWKFLLLGLALLIFCCCSCCCCKK
jgi:hypothetical protein